LIGRVNIEDIPDNRIKANVKKRILGLSRNILINFICIN